MSFTSSLASSLYILNLDTWHAESRTQPLMDENSGKMPIHKLNGTLGLDGSHCSVHILWHNISWKLTPAWTALNRTEDDLQVLQVYIVKPTPKSRQTKKKLVQKDNCKFFQKSKVCPNLRYVRRWQRSMETSVCGSKSLKRLSPKKKTSLETQGNRKFPQGCILFWCCRVNQSKHVKTLRKWRSEQAPRYIMQHAMYLPWRGSHLTIMDAGSKTDIVISATESCSW